ncbi:TraB/GumN family protein [Aquibium sp. A9E412]|uniref:TraB/GumN family protein n=1 Tax=Aquibium sp. A9E412 TaxID=2976767 RepID=UPI0025AFBDF2|nr:TraB/GumN family protein [Aquibium sp. A9E412]MDN2565698.1 TraB/GumN family protein [Aquibium sp. A9E412]
MTPDRTTTDRIATAGLWLAAAAHALFLISLFAAMLLAAGRAGAAEAGCGDDLIAALAAADPARHAAMRAQADATPNGAGLLWRVETDGAAPSHLFGTMHVSDPRVTTLPAAAETTFAAAGTVVIETTGLLDPAKAMAGLMARPEHTMLADGVTHADLLDGADAAALADALAAHGVPPESVARMKPWLLMGMLVKNGCEAARLAAGEAVLDVALGRRAEAAGKRLVGLETVEEQVAALAGLPDTLMLESVVTALRLDVDDVFETMTRLYVAGDTGMFGPFMTMLAPPEADAAETQAALALFDAAIIDGRNATMADRMAPLIDAGGAFVAVGAMHLPGETGLVARLRQAGYNVTAVR